MPLAQMRRRPHVAAVVALVLIALVGCQAAATNTPASPSGPASSAAGTSPAPAELSGEISVMYNPGYEFAALDYGNAWWDTVKKDFEAKYPKASLKLIPITGNLVTTVNKMTLAFRDPSTAPDVAHINVQYAGLFASSGYLLPLDQFLTPELAPFWSRFSPEVQAHEKFDGKVYAIDEGENVSALFYNQKLLKQAGIALPWAPKTWADVLDAARKVKASDPGVYPLWLHAGTSGGAGGIAQGTGNLIYGSSTPMIFDATTNKWVVDSPGLREVLSFYKSVYGEGLGPPTSLLFSPDANGNPPLLMSQDKLAISIGSNWYLGAWVLPGTGATWPNVLTDLGAAPIPTVTGQAPGSASTLQAWAAIVSKTTKNPALAWALIQVMMSESNMVYHNNYAGFVPSDSAVITNPQYLAFAPFQGDMAKYVAFAKSLPGDQTGYSNWFQAFEQATGAMAQDPNSSVDALVKTFASSVSGQLGADKVETLP
jgi:multiple sugar transport system substrate-binding protein